jgi:hypothetical protein
MTNQDTAPSQDQVDKFKFLSPMLDSALSEMREFAKKKQDGIVSKTKIKILNRLLTDIKNVVRHEESAGYLDLLSEEELPQNSDAVLVLGQYRAALDSFETRNRTSDYTRTWMTKEWIEARGEDVEDESEGEDEDNDDELGP